jgi:hypothetical protein
MALVIWFNLSWLCIIIVAYQGEKVNLF